MEVYVSPAAKAFVAVLEKQSAVDFVQVRIERIAVDSFRLRHVADVEKPEELRVVEPEELRVLALHSEKGAFRPLKTAPNLKAGWRVEVCGVARLEWALNALYPGGLADWYAGVQAMEEGRGGPVTDFKVFVNRQTGMYRVAAKLTDDQMPSVILGGCHARFCLRRRMWTAPGAPEDAEGSKSCVPCWEPCAIVLELARRSARLHQEEDRSLRLGPGDMETLVCAMEKVVGDPDPAGREGDSADPLNPRRVQRLIERLRRVTPDKVEGEEA